MYGNHPHGSMSKRDIPRKRKASSTRWRISDGVDHPVTVRFVEPRPAK
jgi:hypothetical protein